MRRWAGAMLVVTALLAVALLLMRDEGVNRTRVHGEAAHDSRGGAAHGAAATDSTAPGREPRGPGGEDGRGDATRETATIRGTVAGESGTIAGVRIFAVVDNRTVFHTGTDVNGHYEVEVPPDRDVVLEVQPEPVTGLLPQTRTFRLAAGEVATYDCQLVLPPTASGRLDPAPRVDVTLFAIRAEDYPDPTDDPLLTAAALDAAPKLWCTTHEGSFRFRSLDPAATYRLAADGIVWSVKDPVYFKAGDEKIVARLDLVAPFSLEVTDIETGSPIPAFRASLRDPHGVSRDMLVVEGGHVSHFNMPELTVPNLPRAAGRRSNEAIRLLSAWTFIVGAEGYFGETVPALDTAVGLQPLRKPNVILRVSLDDGSPYDGALTGTVGSKATLHVRKEAPGRFPAALPAGKWQVHVARPGTFFDAVPVLHLVVPPSGVIEPPPIAFPRAGSVTFESETEFTVQRLVDGHWQSRPGRKGRFDLPIGSYRVVTREEVVHAFEVLAGFHIVIVRIPASR